MLLVRVLCSLPSLFVGAEGLAGGSIELRAIDMPPEVIEQRLPLILPAGQRSLRFDRFYRHGEWNEVGNMPIFSLPEVVGEMDVSVGQREETLLITARMKGPGIFPKPVVDNGAIIETDEHLVIAVDDGRSQRLASAAWLIAPSGEWDTLHSRPAIPRWGGHRGYHPMEMVDDTSPLIRAIDVRTSHTEYGWLAEIEVDLKVLQTAGFDIDKRLLFNVGRATTDDDGKRKAYSLSGSYFAPQTFIELDTAFRSPRQFRPLGAIRLQADQQRQVDRGSQQLDLAWIGKEGDFIDYRLDHFLAGKGQIPGPPLERRLESTIQNSLEWTFGDDWKSATHRFLGNGRLLAEVTVVPRDWLAVDLLREQLPANGRIYALIEIGATVKRLEGCQLVVELYGDESIDQPLLNQVFESPEKLLELAIDLQQAGVEAGDNLKLKVWLLDINGSKLAHINKSLFVLPPRLPESLPENLTLIPVAEIAGTRPYPVVFGIPLGIGQAFSADRWQITDSHGNSLPFTATPVAWWVEDGSWKWVHLRFVAEPDREYSLSFSEGTGPIELSALVSVAGNQLTVDTGLLRFAVAGGDNVFSGFQNLQWRPSENDPWLALPEKQGAFSAADASGRTYRAKGGNVSIEYDDGLAAVLRFNERLGGDTGPIDITTRLYVFRDFASIHWEVFSVFSSNSREFKLKELRLETGLGLPTTELGSVSQRFTDFEAVSDCALESTANQFPPVFSVSDSESGLVLAATIRDMHYMTPLGWGYSNGLFIDLWPDLSDQTEPREYPDESGWVALPFIHRGPVLDFDLDQEILDIPSSEGTRGYFRDAVEGANMMGHGRTHHFITVFSPSVCDAVGLAETWAGYPQLSASPGWIGRTRAVANMPMRPIGDPNAPDIVQTLDQVVIANFLWETTRLDSVHRGKWVRGAAHSQWTDSEKGGYWNPWRSFRNTHHGGPKGYWYLYARTADPMHLAFARRNTAHSYDLGTSWFTDSNLGAVAYFGKSRGAVTDYKGGVPWHSGSRIDYNSYVDHLRNAWYFDADFRAHDTLLLTRMAYLRSWRQSAGKNRPGASRMETAAHLLEHFIDLRLIGYLHRSFSEALTEQNSYGIFSGRKEYGAWLYNYAVITDNPRAWEALLEWVEGDQLNPAFYDKPQQSYLNIYDLTAYAWEQSGDENVFDNALRRLQETIIEPVVLDPDDPEYGRINPNNNAWNWIQQTLPPFLWALTMIRDE